MVGSTRRVNSPLCFHRFAKRSGSHTHSAPAGFLQYVLYQVTSYGFLEEVMRTYVEGVAQALLRCVVLAYDYRCVPSRSSLMASLSPML